MLIDKIDIAISDSCAHAAQKFSNAKVIDLKSGNAIIDFFNGTTTPYSIIATGDFNPKNGFDYTLEPGVAMMYHSPFQFMRGSVRDDFDFGEVLLIDNNFARRAIKGMDCDIFKAGIYDFRLQLSLQGEIVRAESCFWNPVEKNGSDFETAHFAYCDPRNRDYQIEAEKVFTKYLRQTNCLIDTSKVKDIDIDDVCRRFATTATVVIPVKDRPEVIGDAVRSALSQKTDFKFNVIVVDNQSQEPTRKVLRQCQAEDSRLVVIETTEDGIGIGGCWNIAINSEHCGAIAVQLDSDDVYSSANVLQQIVDKFRKERCGVLIGSYRLTDINLNPLNDIIIDHREYTQENGANNALRVNGFGAPRCYVTELVRQNQFKNVSYGEDYDLCLRLSRQYKVGRIFDVLYLCRRWGKNSDSNLTTEKLAQFNFMKDSFRSQEIDMRLKAAKGQAL